LNLWPIISIFGDLIAEELLPLVEQLMNITAVAIMNNVAIAMNVVFFHFS